MSFDSDSADDILDSRDVSVDDTQPTRDGSVVFCFGAFIFVWTAASMLRVIVCQFDG
jgi:hypothetical protein